MGASATLDLISYRATERTYPRTLPTMCFRSRCESPRYSSMSSPGLLSPLVSNNWFFGSGISSTALFTAWSFSSDGKNEKDVRKRTRRPSSLRHASLIRGEQ